MKKVLSSFLFIGMLFSLFFAGALFMQNQTALADDDVLLWYHDKGSNQWTPLSDGYEVHFNIATNTAENVIAVCGETVYRFKNGITVTDEQGETVTEITACGNFTFTVTAEGEHNGKTLVISVVPTRINVADPSVFSFTQVNTAPLGSGIVYTYSYTEQGIEKFYYTTSPVPTAPRAYWQNWSLAENTVATRSIFGVKAEGAVYRIEPYFPRSVISNGEYEAECTGNTADGMGKITATCVLTPKNAGYAFYFDPDELEVYPSGLGLTGENRGNGEVVLTKVWYVARYENELLDFEKTQENQEEVFFSIDGWTFGQAPSVAMPYLRAGDEWRVDISQQDGYTLQQGELLLTHNVGRWDWSTDELQERFEAGESDFVTFSLYLDGEQICANQTRAKWDYYINEFTPVGKYSVVFSCVAIELQNYNTWWSESIIILDSLEYSAFEREYTFEVTADTVKISPFDESQSVELNLDAFLSSPSELTALLYQRLEIGAFVSWDSVKDSDTFWSQSQKYFDSAPRFTFRLEDVDNYLSADGDWSALAPKTYQLFYRVEILNYVVEADEEAVELVVYRELEVPELQASRFTYTGLAQTVALKQESELYVFSDYTATNAGTYTALCSLVDAVHYRWKGVGGRSAELEFVIERAAVKVPSDVESVYTGYSQRAEIAVEKDIFGNDIYVAVYPDDKENGFTEVGEYTVTLKLLNENNYYWSDDDGAIEGDAAITFRITEPIKQSKTITVVIICVSCVAGIAVLGTAAWLIYRKRKHVKN